MARKRHRDVSSESDDELDVNGSNQNLSEEDLFMSSDDGCNDESNDSKVSYLMHIFYSLFQLLAFNLFHFKFNLSTHMLWFSYCMFYFVWL